MHLNHGVSIIAMFTLIRSRPSGVTEITEEKIRWKGFFRIFANKIVLFGHIALKFPYKKTERKIFGNKSCNQHIRQ